MDHKELLSKLQLEGNLENFPDDGDYIELASVIDAEKQVIQQAESKILDFAKQLIETKLNPEAKEQLEAEMLNIQSQVDQLRASCSQKEQTLKEYLITEAANPQRQEAEIATEMQPQETIEKPNTVTQPTVRIVEVDDGMAEEWNTYVTNHPNKSVFHFYGWKAVIEQQIPARCLYLAAVDLENTIVGVLPLVSVKATQKGTFGCSIPLCNSAEPLVNSEGISKRLLWRATEVTKLNKWKHIEIESDSANLSWQSKSQKIRLISDVKSGSEAYLEESLNKEAREAIHAVELNTPSIKVGRKELLDDFYTAYSHQAGSSKKTRFKKSFFADALRSFPEDFNLAVMKLGNTPVAAALLINRNDTLEICIMAISRKCRVERAEEWLCFQLLKYASENNYEKLDFGLHDAARAATSHEKLWQASRIDHYLYYWVAKGSTFSPLTPIRQKRSIF